MLGVDDPAPSAELNQLVAKHNEQVEAQENMLGVLEMGTPQHEAKEDLKELAAALEEATKKRDEALKVVAAANKAYEQARDAVDLLKEKHRRLNEVSDAVTFQEYIRKQHQQRMAEAQRVMVQKQVLKETGALSEQELQQAVKALDFRAPIDVAIAAKNQARRNAD